MQIALYGLAVFSVGCVIPTPLDQATQEPNARPVFVNEKVIPPFGSLGPLAQNQVLTLSLVASDNDRDDMLEVRLFEQINRNLVIISGSQSMVYADADPNPDNKTFRYTTFPQALCAGRAPTSTHFIFAIVADRKFVDPVSSMTPAGGLTDTNHWDLTCN